MKKIGGEFTPRTDEALSVSDELLQIQRSLLPNFGVHWYRHSMVGMKVEALARTLYYAELYRKIVSVPGVICEFGVQWGATLVELINLRSILEPFNHTRHVIGFDTFSGFVGVDERDGKHVSVGDFATTENYFEVLERLLHLHEAAAPLSHIRKFQLVEGDVAQTLPIWLEENPHAIVAMAILDMDLYQPTRAVLERIIPRLTRGSLLVFDDLNYALFPGETVALQEIVGLNNLRLQRSPIQPTCAWAVWGDP